MEQLLHKYESVVEEEQILNERIRACNECVEIILDFIEKRADQIHVLTAEDIVSAAHTIGKDLQTELLHIRLEKGILLNKINKMKEL